MIETVLCVDIGTTSLKAGLISASGEVVSISSKRFSDPENRFIASKWLDSLRRVLKDMQLESVQGIVVSGNGPTLVSETGMTLRWNESIDFEALGIDCSKTKPSLFIPRIASFNRLFRNEFDTSEYIFSGPEYLIYELSGKAVTILPEKRFQTAYWDEKSMEKNNLPLEKMPEYVFTGDICGLLTDAAASFLRLKSGIPIIAGGPDFVVALIGTNTLHSGNICDRCGSSEGFNYCVPSFIQEDGIRSLPSVIPGLWNISVLITKSSRLSEKERFEFAKNAVSKFKKISDKNGIPFPEKITVTGGQAANDKLMREKACELGVSLVACQCIHAELLGDACVGWFTLGKYDSLQNSAQYIVRENKIYESI